MILSIILAMQSLWLQSPPASRLANIKPAPAFKLIDQNGKKLGLSDLNEDVLLVSFVFTTCNGSCPATTHRMAKVQSELQRRGILKNGRVRLLSITLDPKRDTPDVLRGYMNLYEVDPGSWSFLTGPPQKVNRVIADWGMWARPSANGQLDHPSRIFLVDRGRQIREIYNLGFMRTEWVIDDVENLLRERGR